MAAILTASALVPLVQPAEGNASARNDEADAIALKAYSTRQALAAPALVPPATAVDPVIEVRELERADAVREKREDAEAAARAKAKAEAKAKAKAERETAEREAARPKFVKPANGRLTSGFGTRWGTSHNGVDIANSIGTPIVSVAEGTVIKAEPASGFGLWVQVRHDDGTVTVYGHMNEITTSVGKRVEAGEQIATIGNRGQSTGPHLHFEVWEGGGAKIDPTHWLAARGVSL
ncbi:MAG: peptidoglycan DD-metalloendopeptidase family protein [Actinophytocola sp.]|nr:peptidoglycan DD-metalloendopeptidase family protein [Actinophytocola sp.]